MFKQIANFVFEFIPRVLRRALMILMRPAFGSCGHDVFFDPAGYYYSLQNIYVGNSVTLGYRPCLMATSSRIRIGNKVLFGPHVTIIGGNHNTSEIGRFIYDVQNKRAEDDQDVVIEDDVWIGTRVVVLKGVTVGRGCVIAAGAVVNRNLPPYSIAAGVPDRVIKRRWSIDQIMEHEQALYPAEKRLSIESLEQWERSCE